MYLFCLDVFFTHKYSMWNKYSMWRRSIFNLSDRILLIFSIKGLEYSIFSFILFFLLIKER